MAYMEFTTAFTRPADTTAYAAGDLIANSTTAGSVVFPTLTLPRVGTALKILGGVIKKSSAGVTNADFAVHVFSGVDATPVPTNGDNGALNASQVMAITKGDYYKGNLIGAKANIRALTGATFCPLTVGILPYLLIGGAPRERVLTFVFEALAAYAPGNAETFRVGVLWEPIVDDPTV